MNTEKSNVVKVKTYMLPGLDGKSIYRRVRKTANVPFIMLTARADEVDTLLDFELGADDFVNKTF